METNDDSNLHKMKLLVVTTSFPHTREPYSGSFVYELSKRLAEGSAVYVLAPHIEGSPRIDFMGDMLIIRFQYAPVSMQKLCYGAGIVNNIKSNPLNLFLLLPFAVSLIWTAIRIIHDSEIDKIQAHWIIPSGFLCAIVSWITKVPLLVTTHGPDVLMTNKWITKFALRKAQVTATSKFSSDILTRYGIKNTIIPMGVDTNKFHP